MQVKGRKKPLASVRRPPPVSAWPRGPSGGLPASCLRIPPGRVGRDLTHKKNALLGARPECGVYTPIWAHVYDSTVTFLERTSGGLAIGHLS